MAPQREDRIGGILRHRLGTFLDEAQPIDRHLDERGIAVQIRHRLATVGNRPAKRTRAVPCRRQRLLAGSGRRYEPFRSHVVNSQRALVGIVQRIHFGRIGSLSRAERRALNRVDVFVRERSHHAQKFLSEAGIRAHSHAFPFGNDLHANHRAGQRIGHRIPLHRLGRLVSFHLSRRARNSQGTRQHRNHQLSHNHPFSLCPSASSSGHRTKQSYTIFPKRDLHLQVKIARQLFVTGTVPSAVFGFDHERLLLQILPPGGKLRAQPPDGTARNRMHGQCAHLVQSLVQSRCRKVACGLGR